MALTSAEIDYLQDQPLGRLATLQPDGSPQVKPVGFRYNPFMTSRAGFAWHNEYNWLHQDGTGPTLVPGAYANLNTSEFLSGFDFDF